MKSKITTLILIIALGSFLRLYRLDELMGFIGDQGWFYLSARDMLLTGNIPLVGVTASYTWLSQGALWTYMLVPILLLFNFNPVGGAYLSALFGIFSITLIYILGKELYSEKAGLIAAFLLATSPLAINDSRFPYHTSPLAFFSLLFFYFLFKYATSNKNYLILASFALGVLYNLELSTMVFWVILAVAIVIIKKIDLRLLLYSAISFLIPMIPMILYDITSNNGYFQTTAFVRFIKLSIEGSSTGFPINYITEQLIMYGKRLVFIENEFLAIAIIIFSLIFIFKKFLENIRNKKINYGTLLLTFWVFLSIIGIFAKKDVSGAYLPMLYPGIILAVSFLFFSFIKKFQELRFFVYLVVAFFGFSNAILIISRDYNVTGHKDVITYKETLGTSREIIDRAGGSNYNLIVKGEGDEFEAYDDHFEYLTWWFGNPPSEKKESLEITIEQKDGKIYFVNEEKNKD